MSTNIKADFVIKYTTMGRDKFYRYLLSTAIFKVVVYLEKNEKAAKAPAADKLPDMELLEMYERFLVFYRRENEDVYLDIAKLCRKAGHKVYRALLRQNLVQRNAKFLNLIE